MGVTIAARPAPRVIIQPKAGPSITLAATSSVSRITVSARGPQGALGPQGPVGGQPTRLSYLTPALQWAVPHNLGRRPMTALETIGGVEMIAEVTHLTDNTLIVGFDAPTAGFITIL